MTFKTLLAAAFLASSAPALAIDTYTITETVPADAVSEAGGVADIIGIKPGMPADEALSIIADNYGGADKVDRFRLKIGTAQVQSQGFDLYYKAGSALGDGLVHAYLTSPVAGNKVFAAYRSVEFHVEDGLPKFEALTEQLVAKYGKPHVVHNFSWDKGGPRYSWYLGGSGQCPPEEGVCHDIYNGGSSGGPGGVMGAYDIAKVGDYEKSASLGTGVVIVAAMREHSRYPGSASSLSVSFVDLRLRAAAARADYDLIVAEQAKFDAKKVSLPKL